MCWVKCGYLIQLAKQLLCSKWVKSKVVMTGCPQEQIQEKLTAVVNCPDYLNIEYIIQQLIVLIIFT